MKQFGQISNSLNEERCDKKLWVAEEENLLLDDVWAERRDRSTRHRISEVYLITILM